LTRVGASGEESGRSRRGFYVDLYEDGHPDTIADEYDLPGLVAGTLRVRFDPITKVLSLFFDVSQADADDWIPFRTISVGDTAAQKSVDWSMTETDFFSISVYGLGVDVEEGTVRADNFTTIGGFRP
jgi:hypothetical protein